MQSNSCLNSSGDRRDSITRIQRCQESLKDMYEDSNIFDDSNCDISSLKLSDVKAGSVIGKGTFGQIRSLTCLPSEISFTQMSSRNSSSSICNLEETKIRSDSRSDLPTPQKYVLKEIRGSIANDCNEATFDAAAIDLVKESRFLQLLSHHENIIGFYCTGGCEGSRDFFILIEKIEKTLDDLFFREWRHLQRNLNCIRVQQYLKDQISSEHDLCKTPRRQHKDATQKFLILRLQVIVGITSGLAFLHENNVLFRDLKPTNIGISREGVPVIFDFGLARELKSRDKVDEEGNYKLTEMVGTLRYMAPEVYRGNPYGLASDVYSLTMLLYEALTLIKPFCSMNPFRFERVVFDKNKRPKIYRTIPKDIRQQIKKGWHRDPKLRPSAKDMHECIQKHILE